MKPMGAMMLMMFFAATALAQMSETESLKRQVAEQARQIDELQRKLGRLERVILGEGSQPDVLPEPVTGVTLVSVVPVAAPAIGSSLPVMQRPAAVGTIQGQNAPQIAGFRFDGDFRLRFDAYFRDPSPTTAGAQTTRQRYRFRLNVDRDIAPDLKLHVQLSTGAVNNGLTFDQDFAGGVTRHPFFVSEAFVEYRPTSNVWLRGGRLEEVFADNSRFLWDDDVRFNGFNERWR